MPIRRLAATALLWAGVAASTTAQAQTRPCLTDGEAEALFQVLLPDMVSEMGRVCATLPPSAFLRRPNPAFAARLQSGVTPALPAARSGIAKLLGPQMQGLAESQFVIPALKVLIVPVAAQQIEANDCPKLDKIVANLAPLPPRNLAGVFVGLAQLNADRQKSGPRLPLCPMPRPK
ncbi:hypothetical protein FPZ54_04760 [Sphingomonas suaedae]|uniref:Uncharacterized protein n=1 Tax=Sphingomonas suaedae TaxID=2599297 RepID=A0A518RD70_9SPHN|nr:hypothetical protein [Sphingomonas suaedae]QDX25403.1 hypothetical protein FPZ54_04760 [Sphingomonas suaedae]